MIKYYVLYKSFKLAKVKLMRLYCCVIITPPRRSYVTVVVCLSFVRSVCLSVCEQDYCESNQPISLKLGVRLGLPIRRTD